MTKNKDLTFIGLGSTPGEPDAGDLFSGVEKDEGAPEGLPPELEPTATPNVGKQALASIQATPAIAESMGKYLVGCPRRRDDATNGKPTRG